MCQLSHASVTAEHMVDVVEVCLLSRVSVAAEHVLDGLQPDTSTTPLPMRYASMGYTSTGFPSMGYTSTKLLNFTVLIVLL